MSKSDLKSMYDLMFRWWKDEVAENKELLKKYEALKLENEQLKIKIHEQSKNSLHKR